MCDFKFKNCTEISFWLIHFMPYFTFQRRHTGEYFKAFTGKLACDNCYYRIKDHYHLIIFEAKRYDFTQALKTINRLLDEREDLN